MAQDLEPRLRGWPYRWGGWFAMLGSLFWTVGRITVSFVGGGTHAERVCLVGFQAEWFEFFEMQLKRQ